MSGWATSRPAAIQHEGVAGLPDLDGRDHVPDQLEIDLGDNHADGRSIAGDRDRQVGLGAAVVADLAVPDPRRARSGDGRVGGAVGAALGSVEADPRHVKALPSGAVDEREADDGRHLTEQAQGIDPPPLVRLLGPGKLDQPAELVGDAVDEALDPGCRRPRLDAEQLVEPRPLVAIAEPRLADAIGREGNDHGQEQHEEVLLEEATKPETPPDHRPCTSLIGSGKVLYSRRDRSEESYKNTSSNYLLGGM